MVQTHRIFSELMTQLSLDLGGKDGERIHGAAVQLVFQRPQAIQPLATVCKVDTLIIEDYQFLNTVETVVNVSYDG